MKSNAERKKQLKGHAYQVWNSGFGRCLAPGNECARSPIRAHSVQRQGPIRLLSAEGHVVMLRQHLDLNRGPTIAFESVGVNKATVFTGLCSEHDCDLFERIDQKPLALADPECLLLHAYRAVLRETHVCLEAAAKLQSVYQKQCDLELADRNIPTRGGMIAVERMIIAYQTWLYKECLDQAVLQRDFSAISHDVVDLGHTGPCIGVSSLFSLDDAPVSDDVARVALTVIPVPSGGTYALFSYLARDAATARAWLQPVVGATGHTQRYLLSRLILERSDNIVINPTVYEQWSEDRREVIQKFFAMTVLKNNGDFQDKYLNLFDIDVG